MEQENNKSIEPKKDPWRPTLYKKEMIGQIDDYLEKCKDNYKEIATKDPKVTKIRFRVHIPTLEGFAEYLNTSDDNLKNWGKKHKRFFTAMQKIKAKQKTRLIEMGLSGEYNSTITKLMLSANHGMSEQVGIDHTTKGDKVVPILGGITTQKKPESK